MINSDQKKKFVIALSNQAATDRAVDWIKQHVRNPQILIALDGNDAYMRITNDIPHVVILDKNLPKMTGEKLLEALLLDKRCRDLSFIFQAEIPEHEVFVDAVVTGQLQFLHSQIEDFQVGGILARALNFAFRNIKNDFRLKFLAAGEQLIRQGEKAEDVYIVKRGQLRAYSRKDGKTVELGRVEEGEFVGEMSYINHTQRSADVIASTDCELIMIPVDYLDHLLFHKPSWSKALMQTLARRLSDNNKKIA